MKKNALTLLTYVMLAVAIITGCTKEEEVTTSKEVGYLSLNLGLNIENANGRLAEVNTDTWNVTIYDANYNFVTAYDNFIDVPDAIELAEGDYYVTVTSEDENSVLFDTPFYTGTSDIFTIVKGDVVPVAVSVALASVKVTVHYSAAIQSDFNDWNTTVSSLSGSLLFNKDEIRSGYFIAGEELDIAAELTYTNADLGTEMRTVTGIISNTASQDHYIITVDYTLENGTASPLSLIVDENTVDIPIDISGGAVTTFSKTFGGSLNEYCGSVAVTNDGGYIALGYTESNNGDVTGNNGLYDIWIVKLDKAGNLEWKKTYGGSSRDYGYQIKQINGEYLIIGHTYSNNGDVSENKGGSDLWVIKLDESGNLAWEKTYGGTANDVGRSIQTTSDNGYIIAGETYSNNGDIGENKGGSDFWVLKLDENGNLEWERTYGGTANDWPIKMALAHGNYLLTGFTESNNGDISENKGGRDIWVIKLDENGNLIWEKTYGGSGTDESFEVKVTNDNGYIVTGYTNSNDGDVTENKGGYDRWIIKLNENGDIIWQNTYGGSADDFALTVSEINGGYLISGNTDSNDGDVTENKGGRDAWLMKIDEAGNLIWEKTYGGSSTDNVISIQSISNVGCIMVGHTESNDGDVPENKGVQDLWVIRVDEDGNL